MSDRGSMHPSSDADAPEAAFPAQPAASSPNLARIDDQPSPTDGQPSTVNQQPVPIDQPFEINDRPFSLTGFDEDRTDQGQDENEDETKHRRSKVRRTVLAALLAVGLAGAAALLYAGWQISSQKDATLTAPAQIGSLTLDESEDGRSTADYLQTALAAEVDLDKTVGAVYADAARNNVLFLGGTGLIWSPEKNLDAALGLIADNQGPVTGLHQVDAGELGGTMKCGTTKSDDGDLAVCGWADHGSVALAMFPGHSTSESATLLLKIRDATESRP
jgi:hypothetical protein